MQLRFAEWIRRPSSRSSVSVDDPLPEFVRARRLVVTATLQTVKAAYWAAALGPKGKFALLRSRHSVVNTSVAVSLYRNGAH